MSGGRRWRGPLALLVSLLVLFVAAEWNSGTPVLRFAHPAWNRAALLAAYALPWLAIVPARRLPRVARAAALVLLLPFLLFTGFFSFFVWHDLVHVRGGVDASLEPLQAVAAAGGSRIVAYRTNCGATCAFGVTVRQERPLGGGLLLVRRLAGWYPADSAVLAPVPGGGVRVTVPGWSPPLRPRRNDETTGTRVLAPRPWVYF
jgi:hypothetical protein